MSELRMRSWERICWVSLLLLSFWSGAWATSHYVVNGTADVNPAAKLSVAAVTALGLTDTGVTNASVLSTTSAGLLQATTFPGGTPPASSLIGTNASGTFGGTSFSGPLTYTANSGASNGILTSNALPTAGGTMTGNISLNADGTILFGSPADNASIVFTREVQDNTGLTVGPLLISGAGGIKFTGGNAADASNDLSFNNKEHIHGSPDMRGQASTTASTSVAVTFGLAYSGTPVGVSLTPLSDPGSGVRYWVSGLSTTGFTINTSAASTLTFSWIVIQ